MSRPTVLLVASNGVGLGHVTRTAAIARRLPALGVRPVLVTMSPVIAALRELGLLVEYVQGYTRTALPRWRWQQMLADQLTHLADVHAASAVVFDGVSVYSGVRSAMERPGAPPFVWVRRGLWRQSGGAHAAAHGFALVLTPREPGEVDGEGVDVAGADAAPVRTVEPVLLHDAADLLPAAAARRRLDLPSRGAAVLVSLGIAARGALATAEATVCAALLARGVQPVVARSPLIPPQAAPPVPSGAAVVHHYPLAPYLSAVDAAVVAAGYNSVAEMQACHVPAVLVPSPAARTDDQDRRAAAAAAARLAVVWRPQRHGPEAALDAVLDGPTREQLRANLAARPPVRGAEQAAAAVAEIATRPGSTHRPAPTPRNRRLALSGWAYTAASAAYGAFLRHGPDRLRDPLRRVVAHHRDRLRPPGQTLSAGIALPGEPMHDAVLLVVPGLDAARITALRDVVDAAACRPVWLTDDDDVRVLDGTVLEHVLPPEAARAAELDPVWLLGRRLAVLRQRYRPRRIVLLPGPAWGGTTEDLDTAIIGAVIGGAAPPRSTARTDA